METESVSSNPSASKPIEERRFPFGRWLSWLVTILVPVALTLTFVRLMMTSVFLNIEYNMPGFPADTYGFTKADRLHWSKIAKDYLINDAGIEFLGDLRFSDGSPVYNERELGHMVDVKKVVQKALTVWLASLVLLLGLELWAWRGGWIAEYRLGLWRGGWLTVILVGTIILFVLLSFNVFFVAFHNVFFAPGTWVFHFSDTLIRLFPERFWQDIFIYVGGLSLVAGLGLGVRLRRKIR
jgi:integral membrane protein (TIGR01906 family)